MRTIVAIGLIGCGSGVPSAPHPSAPNPVARIEAEVVTELAAPAAGRVAMIMNATNETAVLIDEAGIAHRTGNVLIAGAWIPFSVPVDDVVFFREFAFPNNVPGAQLGKMFCARTLSAGLECVLDFEQTPKATRLVRRFRLPVDGVRQFGVFRPWTTTGGPDRVICAIGRRTACFSFDWGGTYAEPYMLAPEAAEAVALRIAPETRAAWSRAAPHVNARAIREVVRTDRKDYARVIHDDADLTVHCARLERGELTCFGAGVYGELGDGMLAVTARASRPLGDAKVVDVAAARHHVCAVIDDGRVACWGDLGDRVPLAKSHKPTPLRMCPLDRAASEAKFEADRAAAIERSKQCSKTCRGSTARDACLGCVVECTRVPYVFDHKTICQEPQIDGTLVQRGLTCIPVERPGVWLTDPELRDQVSTVNLTLSPVFLPDVTDAIGVTVEGRTACVLRRGGQVACFHDGKLTTSPHP